MYTDSENRNSFVRIIIMFSNNLENKIISASWSVKLVLRVFWIFLLKSNNDNKFNFNFKDQIQVTIECNNGNGYWETKSYNY